MFKIYHVEILSESKKRSEGKTMIGYSVSVSALPYQKKKENYFRLHGLTGYFEHFKMF